MIRLYPAAVVTRQLHFNRFLSTCQPVLDRRRGNRDQRQRSRRQEDLQVFRQQDELDISQISNVHVNPAAHYDILKPSLVSPQDSRLLRVNILGVPNSGKSTLVNQLVGFNVCAHSQKVHTTRSSARAILTENNSQVVFLDTPGVVSKEEAKKFNLEESLLNDPVAACKGSDLILVLQDVSNRFVRESIDKRILKILCYNFETPAILVLNKLDTIPRSRRVYDLIRKLTCGHLDGVKQKVEISKLADTLTVDSYLQRKQKEELMKLKGDSGSDSNIVAIRSYNDFIRVLSETKLTDSLVTELTKGLVGWPKFKEVFTVSALNGNGVDDLKRYLINAAKPNSFDFPGIIYTDDDPRDTVKKIVKAKFLDVLPSDVPYKINPTIQTWSMDSGVLRLGIQVDSDSPRSTALLLGQKAKNLSQVAKLAEVDLQNFFQCSCFFEAGLAWSAYLEESS